MVGLAQDGRSMNLAQRVVEELLRDVGTKCVDFEDDEERDYFRERWTIIVEKQINRMLGAALVVMEDDEDDEINSDTIGEIDESIESLS